VAAHLPSGGRFALRDYGVLGAVRHPWRVTAWSAVIGAVSHIVWDAFTHPYVDGGRLLFPWLHDQVVPGLPWWELLVRVSDLVGFAVGLGLALHLGKARLLRRWHGAPPPAPRRPAVFWTVVSTVVGAGLAALPFQPARLLPGQAIRCLVIACLALLAGTVAVRLTASRRRPVSKAPLRS
jgi:Domain of unknown function (DUF4184)